MTLGSKKFDRYALPASVALDVVAGVGLWRLAHRIGAHWTALATVR